MSKIGIILSGCGVYDGSEIYESTFSMLSLDKLGHSFICFAPEKPQMDVIHHASGEGIEGAKRDVYESASRLARGNIKPLTSFEANDWDGVIFPGGFGAAKNLCDFATKGADCSVDADVERCVQSMKQMNKPMTFLCIAPTIAACVLGNEGIRLTIGNDQDTAQKIEQMGATHVDCEVGDYVYDERFHVFTSPAYMLGENMKDVASGIDKTLKAMHEQLCS